MLGDGVPEASGLRVPSEVAGASVRYEIWLQERLESPRRHRSELIEPWKLLESGQSVGSESRLEERLFIYYKKF